PGIRWCFSARTRSRGMSTNSSAVTSSRISGHAAGIEELVMTPSVDVAAQPPGTVLSTLDELLRKPDAGFARARSGAPIGAWAIRVFGGSLVCCALYGAGSGFFAGGAQIGIAAVKAPLIVAWSALLCLPSLYVFGLLAGAALTRARFAVTLIG